MFIDLSTIFQLHATNSGQSIDFDRSINELLVSLDIKSSLGVLRSSSFIRMRRVRMSSLMPLRPFLKNLSMIRAIYSMGMKLPSIEKYQLLTNISMFTPFSIYITRIVPGMRTVQVNISEATPINAEITLSHLSSLCHISSRIDIRSLNY